MTKILIKTDDSQENLSKSIHTLGFYVLLASMVQVGFIVVLFIWLTRVLTAVAG